MDSITSTDTGSKRLEGKVAIVTGGASGIGASAVELFCKHGAQVIIADIQDELGEALVARLGETVRYIECDVTVEEQVRAVVDAAVAWHGKLDIMYNNAGIVDRVGGSILDSSRGELERVMSVNLRGAFYGAKHAARVMAPRKQGCILFTASSCTSCLGGFVSNPYVMSKYAVFGLVRNLSGELSPHGIRVNCVSPVAVKTGLFPFARFHLGSIHVLKLVPWLLNWFRGQTLTAQSVAAAALYLASDEDSRYVTGHNLVLDGGSSAASHSFLTI